MKKISLFIFSILLFAQCKAPQKTTDTSKTISAAATLTPASSAAIYTRPKLVVGIVVDQMRYDYITRYWNKYGDDGFKRLINGGFNFKNGHYNYVPTYTAPGHTSVYTGTSPRYHGIIANNWYDKFAGKSVYCVDDHSVQSVGTTTDEGERSPQRLLASTFGDQNRLATQFKGKTIGIALKDRAAILPAGHAANAAYWFDGGKVGHFVTSTYYLNELPQWVKAFNASGKTDTYLNTPWETLYPIDTYTESGADLNDYEGGFDGKATATFPYDLKALAPQNGGYSLLKSVSFGNSLTTDFALAAIDGEDLGQDTITDVLTVSYSSTDYVGHNFGVNSKEAEDTYLRLDKDLARLLKGLDEKVGRGNYTVFLTADHAGVHVPAYLKDKKMAAGYFSSKKLRKAVKSFLADKFGSEKLIANISNKQIFFDYDILDHLDIDQDELAEALKHFLVNYPQIAQAYTRDMIEGATFTGMIAKRIKNGFNPKRSGDVIYVLEPATISYSHTGSTHGSPYNYDTHVPIIFYGAGINHGQSYQLSRTIDIAPTITALLGINAPNAATGQPLEEAIK